MASTPDPVGYAGLLCWLWRLRFMVVFAILGRGEFDERISCCHRASGCLADVLFSDSLWPIGFGSKEGTRTLLAKSSMVEAMNFMW